MFESAELGHTIDKETYDKELPALRSALLEAQYDLKEARKFPVVILIGGVDGAGKGETVNLLNEWMDPRHISTHAMGSPSEEQRERPPMWRFWCALPPKGTLGIFFGSWYTDPIVRHAHGEIDDAKLELSMAEVVRFEDMLTAEGALILKFWLHLSKKEQKKRLKMLEADALTSWRVTKLDWENHALYDSYRRTSERALRLTSTGVAPWTVVEGVDRRYRSLTIATAIQRAIRRRLDDAEPQPAREPPRPPEPRRGDVNILRALAPAKPVDDDNHDELLEERQGELNVMTRHKRFNKISVVAVFEGADAAGKGGAIRRVTSALDARQYDVVPVAAPTEEERAQPYLWRFWRNVPKRGAIAIFDRSWYGRVLVERVEGFAREADWMRAYGEINDFEAQLAQHGAVVVKFWLQISKEEQLRRFEDRTAVGFKRHKITPEDWRNRDKWDAYELAVCDMVERTSTEIAPWTLLDANDKRAARIAVIDTISKRIRKALAR
jgi:polyphosphate:AMP phosphotransferase